MRINGPIDSDRNEWSHCGYTPLGYQLLGKSAEKKHCIEQKTTGETPPIVSVLLVSVVYFRR